VDRNLSYGVIVGKLSLMKMLIISNARNVKDGSMVTAALLHNYVKDALLTIYLKKISPYRK
jgi:hypothetical protein